MIGERSLANDDWRGIFSEGDNLKDKLSKDRCQWSLIINIRVHCNFLVVTFSLENFGEIERLSFELFILVFLSICSVLESNCVFDPPEL